MGSTRNDVEAQAGSVSAAPSSGASGASVTPVAAALTASAAPPATTPPPPTTAFAPDAPVGHLEHVASLTRFFERLADLEASRGTGDVRIAQLGDSHTASDYGVSVVRAQLVARFGDGGRGFIPIGPPYKRLFQAGELVSDGTDFDPLEGHSSGGKPAGDGCYGPSGIAMVATKGGARVYSTYGVAAPSLEVAYAEAPRGGSFDVSIDGKKAGRIETRGDARKAAFRAFEAADTPHRVEIRANGDGEVRVFGVRLDRDKRGVTVDALGINGAKATTPLDWDAAHTAEQMKHIAPALVVFAYGTNELGDSTTPEQHEAAFVELARRVRAGAPGASCLILGVPDRASKSGATWTTMPKLDAILAAQKRAAATAGCAFFNQLDAMGGPGTIDAWAHEAKARARNDRVHFTRDGYATLATALTGDLLRAYDGWKKSAAR